MKAKNFTIMAAAAIGVYMLMRARQTGAWTIPGSQQDRMLKDQWAAFNAVNYSNAYSYMPGTIQV